MTAPPTADPADAPEPPVNGYATAGVIAGLLACIPGTGLVAVPLSAIGLRRAGKLGGAGRSAAVLGLTLGLINLLWYSAIFVGVLQTKRAFDKGKPAINATGQFVLLVGKGDLGKARTFCDPTITDDQLADLAGDLGEPGPMRQPNPYYGGEVHGNGDVEIQCEINYAAATRVLVTHWDVRGESPKLLKFELKKDVATRPAGT